MQNQTFKLSLKPNDYPPNLPFVYADQYDVGRTFVATVYDADGTLYNFTTETVTVVGTKPSGTGFSYAATASGNTVTFETTGQMTVVAGNVTCGIIIEKDGDRIGTLHFVLHVQPAALSSDTIIDSDDFGSIISGAVEEYMEEHGIVIDDTLSVAGAAADAKATGDAIDELKSAFDLGCITPEVKTALMNLVNHIGAWTDGNSQTYIADLYTALYLRYWQVTNTLSHCTTSNSAEQVVKGGSYSATITASAGYVMTGATVSITMGGADITSTAYNNGTISIDAVTGALVITISAVAKTVSSISAVFTQGANVVYTNDTLDSLKQYLVVTATYSDSSSETIQSTDYTLSGTLAEGTQTITVTFGGKTDTFTVNCAVNGYLYHFSQSLASSGTKDFGWQGTGNYSTGPDGTGYSYWHDTTDGDIGAIYANSLSEVPTLIGDFTIAFWLKTMTEKRGQGLSPFKVSSSTQNASTTGFGTPENVKSGYTVSRAPAAKGVEGCRLWYMSGTTFQIRLITPDLSYGAVYNITAFPSSFASTDWHHYAFTRKDGTFRFFIDGEVVFSLSSVTSQLLFNTQVSLGGYFNAAGDTTPTATQYGNYFDDLYITDWCKWDSSFTPSAITY